MSQAKPGPEPELRCWDCGAVNDYGSSECWLCQRRDWRRHRVPGHDETAPVPVTLAGPFASLAGFMILLTAIAVLFGLYGEPTWLPFALLIGATLAMAITEVKANRRRQRGDAMSGMERFLWLVGLMIVIPVALIAARAAALFVVFSGAERGTDPAAVIFIGLIAAFLVFFIIAIAVTASRRAEREQDR
jgi:hypothetical protein